MQALRRPHIVVAHARRLGWVACPVAHTRQIHALVYRFNFFDADANATMDVHVRRDGGDERSNGRQGLAVGASRVLGHPDDGKSGVAAR